MLHPHGDSDDLLCAVQRECTAILHDIGCADADRRAAALVRTIRRDYGGQMVYVPSGRRERRAAIATALATGSSPEKVALAIGCHRATVFRVRRARDMGGI